jgi:SpoVK/Ycf46/Vps4 family AAA+-type ATPase
MNFTEKLAVYLKAAYPIIGVETYEEGRLLETGIYPLKMPVERRLYQWDCATGMVDTTDRNKPVKLDKTADPMAMLAIVSGNVESAIFVLKDIHAHFNNVRHIRMLRSMIKTLSNRKQTIVLVAPRLNLPFDLQKDVQMMDFALPTKAELSAMTETFIETSIRRNENAAYKEFRLSLSDREAIVEAATGMTSIEFCNALSSCSIGQSQDNGKLTMTGDFPKRIFDEKIINLKNGLLEYVPEAGGFDTIGGLTPVKEWAKQRRLGYEEVARKAHLPYPKGCLLVGLRGCGKSVLAMAIAQAFNFPLFKLDIGKIFGSKVGESEGNVRELIRLLEGLGRAVIYMDEIEKGLNNSAASGQGDSGTGSRVFGTLISWMAIKKCPVFLIGTANNIDVLPPELIRKGRFDEIWWVDLPTSEERVDIFNKLLQHKFQREFEVTGVKDKLITSTKDYSGAEIEAVIEAALYEMLSSKDKNFRKILESTIERTEPQAQINPEYINKMREKSKAGYRKANDPEVHNASVSNMYRKVQL